MIKKLLLITSVAFMSFGFQAKSCQPQDNQTYRIGPDVRADIVYFFKKETTPNQINEFDRTVVGIPAENGTGHREGRGVRPTLLMIWNCTPASSMI
jgi:hypothetical protein